MGVMAGDRDAAARANGWSQKETIRRYREDCSAALQDLLTAVGVRQEHRARQGLAPDAVDRCYVELQAAVLADALERGRG